MSTARVPSQRTYHLPSPHLIESLPPATLCCRSGAGLGGPHPASAALQVEAASTSSRAFVRRYGPVWGVVTAGAAAKLGLDHYREYAECHQLLQPWTGKMIKMDAGALATRQAETLLGRVADGMWCIGARTS